MSKTDRIDPFSIINYKNRFINCAKGTVDDAIWIIGGALAINRGAEGGNRRKDEASTPEFGPPPEANIGTGALAPKKHLKDSAGKRAKSNFLRH